jgi:hypothetical protein
MVHSAALATPANNLFHVNLPDIKCSSPINNTVLTPTMPPAVLPPAEPPPPPSIDTTFSPGSFFNVNSRMPSPCSVTIDLRTEQKLNSALAKLPQWASISNIISHVVCTPRTCGIHSDLVSNVHIFQVLATNKSNCMVDGGSNVCVTGDLGILLNVIDINLVAILVALDRGPPSLGDCITKWGLLPLTLANGPTYYQMCFYCTNIVGTIISPAAILAASDVFIRWNQEGYKDPSVPGSICFTRHNGLVLMYFKLHCCDGLYYCLSNVYTVDHELVHVYCHHTVTTPVSDVPPPLRLPPSKYVHQRENQIESKVWALHFGSPGKQQLDTLPHHVLGTPSSFNCHPF